MSVCSVAVGVLWLIAIVHIMLSVVLAALIAGACYYGKQKQRRRDNEITISEDTLARERSEALQELESPDKLFLSSPPRVNEPPVPSLEEPSLPETTTKVDLGLFTVATGEGSRRNSSERPRAANGGDEGTPLRKRSRISVISNISNRFRKSMDFDSARDDAMRLVRERSSSSSERVSSEDRDIYGGAIALSSSAPSNYDNMMIVNESVVEINVGKEESEC